MARLISLAVSDRGSVYIVDGANQRVICFNRDLTPLKDFTGRGDLAVAFSEPRSVTVDVDHNVWVSDFGHRRLVRANDRLDLTAEIDLRNDTALGGLGRPGGAIVTSFGDIWVLDADNQRIAVLDPVGDMSLIVGDFGYPGGKLDHPSKMVVGPDDHVWVCDSGNRRVVVYDGEGGVVAEINDPILEDPVSVVIDSQRRAWILDSETGKIHCFDRDRRYLSTVGPMISGADQPLLHPVDLAFMPDGRFVIIDGLGRLLICRPISATPGTTP